MTKRNILKIALITTVATFTVITHNKAIQHQNELRLQKAMNFTYKTEKQKYDEIYKMWIKPSQEKEAKEIAEKRKQEELKKIEEQKNLSRGGIVEERTFILTFYTSLDCENGYGAITCEGKRLRDGMVANNILPLHTKINLVGYGDVEVADRGGNNFNTEERLDVFVPKKSGESDYHYEKRVNGMGKVKVKGYIIK